MSIQFCFTEINSIVKLTETLFKGTLSVISSDPPCKDGNARFTTIPDVFFFFRLFMFIYGFSAKVTCLFFGYKKQWRSLQK